MSRGDSTNPQRRTPAPAQLRDRLGWSDEKLLEECDIHTYRASGPGGQKRNKTSSAVRLRHRATGLTTIGEESRSQHVNKSRALRRLREAIAIHVRLPTTTPVSWPPGVQMHQGRLTVSERNPEYCTVLAMVLDMLEAEDGRVAQAAAKLQVSTSSLTRFLRTNKLVWAEANRIRETMGLPPLRAD